MALTKYLGAVFILAGAAVIFWSASELEKSGDARGCFWIDCGRTDWTVAGAKL